MLLKYILPLLFFVLNAPYTHTGAERGLEAPRDGYDQLILFVNSESPIIDTEDLDALKKLADKIEVDFRVKDVVDGAPQEVTYTPSIVFQNSEGRSFYYGRYKKTSRVKNFIRASRLAHQGDTDNVKKDILVWKNGRTAVTAPIKLTDLTGEVPRGFNQEEFINEAKASVAEGMSDFERMSAFEQTRTTRSFYFNLYPYLYKGRLTVSAEIYSQYNCVKPVFQKFDEGLASGSWRSRDKVFAEAGKLIEVEIMRQTKNLQNGDALAIISDDIPVKDWEALGLELPEKPKIKINTEIEGAKITQNWTVEPPQNKNEPILIFSFLPPLDSYAGEAKTLSGTLDLSEGNTLTGAKGSFEVQISDITMGLDDLDREVQNKMLKMGMFPNSTFTFEEIEAKNDEPLQFGQTSEFTAKGIFTMLGIETPLDVPAQIEPIVNARGEARLQVSATFQLPLYSIFKVAGPDGPSPAKDNLQFYMKFLLASSE